MGLMHYKSYVVDDLSSYWCGAESWRKKYQPRCHPCYLTGVQKEERDIISEKEVRNEQPDETSGNKIPEHYKTFLLYIFCMRENRNAKIPYAESYSLCLGGDLQ
ncbi:hypothetical protein AVEN_176073-1, partial [Araneus ventricosus]